MGVWQGLVYLASLTVISCSGTVCDPVHPLWLSGVQSHCTLALRCRQCAESLDSGTRVLLGSARLVHWHQYTPPTLVLESTRAEIRPILTDPGAPSFVSLRTLERSFSSCRTSCPTKFFVIADTLAQFPVLLDVLVQFFVVPDAFMRGWLANHYMRPVCLRYLGVLRRRRRQPKVCRCLPSSPTSCLFCGRARR